MHPLKVSSRFAHFDVIRGGKAIEAQIKVWAGGAANAGGACEVGAAVVAFVEASR
jgi:hypothetical protein